MEEKAYCFHCKKWTIVQDSKPKDEGDGTITIYGLASCCGRVVFTRYGKPPEDTQNIQISNIIIKDKRRCSP
jgi:hypothetical protein